MMNAKLARKASEKSLISSQINLETHEQNGQSHLMTRNISRLLHIPKVNNTSTQRSESVNEIETMNNLLIEMQKEYDKRNEMLNSVFDKNFDRKIKTCIDARAKMEAHAAAFEKIIQSQTLIKKPIKNITIENTYEEIFGTNHSQTGSTSDKLIMSPMEEQQVKLKYTAGGHFISPQPTHIAADIISPNEIENKQISMEDTETADKKVTKGFGEAALGNWSKKVGNWSKKAFKFLRKGKDTTISRNDSRKKLHAEKYRSRHHVRDVKMKGIPQENFRRTRSSRKVKSRSHRKAKSERSKKREIRRSIKKRKSEKVKFVPKMSTAIKFGKTSNAVKKHAAKLTEAKKRLKERTAINFEKEKLNPEEEIHESVSHRGLIIGNKRIKKNVGKSKKSSKKETKKTIGKSKKKC